MMQAGFAKRTKSDKHLVQPLILDEDDQPVSKIWWTRWNLGPNPFYVLALCKISTFMATAGLESVHHLQSMQYFHAICLGKHPGRFDARFISVDDSVVRIQFEQELDGMGSDSRRARGHSRGCRGHQDGGRARGPRHGALRKALT